MCRYELNKDRNVLRTGFAVRTMMTVILGVPGSHTVNDRLCGSSYTVLMMISRGVRFSQLLR